MPKRKTTLEKLMFGARAEGVKPNIPVYKPTGSKKLVRRLHEDDVEIEKFIGAIISVLGQVAAAAASTASAAAGAVGSAAGAAGGAVARGAMAAGRGAARAAKSGPGKEVGRGVRDAAMEGGEAPTAPPVEEPEDEMEAEAQQTEAPQESTQPQKPTKRDKAVADIQALFSKSAEYTSNKQAPEHPPRASLGIHRIDWKKKEHGEPTSSIEKEGDGGGTGAGVGGTVFTSTNAGIFTPTYGGSGSSPKEKDKKKPKSTGIERLGRFLTDGSPLKLDKSSTFDLVEFLHEVRLDLRKEQRQVPYGSKPTEDDPPQMVERYNPPKETQEPKEDGKMPKSDEDIKRDKIIDESKQSHHGLEEPYGMQLQQTWGSGHTEVDSLKRGGKSDILTPPPESAEEEQDTTIPEDPDLKVVGTEGYEKYLKYLRQMEKEGDSFPLMNAFWKAIDDPD